MRFVRRSLFAAAVGLGVAASASAQTATGTTTTQNAGVGIGSGGGGGNTGGGGNNGNTGNTGVADFTPLFDQASIGLIQQQSSSLNQSNQFSGFYANPYYQGRTGAQPGDSPGGFGSPLYGTAGGGSGVSVGGQSRSFGGGGTGGGGATGFGGIAAGGQSLGGNAVLGGTGGRTSTGLGGGSTGLGGGITGLGNTGLGGGSSLSGLGGAGRTSTGLGGGAAGGRASSGFGGTSSGGGLSSPVGGQIVPLSRQIAYTATIKFASPPVQPSRVLTDVRAAVDRSSMLSNPRGVEVSTDGPNVTLRGTVRDEDEARLVEGMVRLTPGVRNVQNELRFPAP